MATEGDQQGSRGVELVVESLAPGVKQVRLNRPHRLNALTPELVTSIREAFEAVATDRTCRVVVLTGTGRGFCAGLDLVARSGVDQSTRYPGERLDSQEGFAAMVQAIRRAPQPVIAAVNGPCAGAGFALTLAADVRVAAWLAAFHVAAVKIGLSAGECGISYHLPRAVGATRAFEIMLTGRPVDAEEADRIGLVSRVLPDEGLIGGVLDLAAAIAANSVFAMRMTKQVMWANIDATSLDAALELENRSQILATLTRDSAEAMSAFVEKRAPNLTGE